MQDSVLTWETDLLDLLFEPLSRSINVPSNIDIGKFVGVVPSRIVRNTQSFFVCNKACLGFIQIHRLLQTESKQTFIVQCLLDKPITASFKFLATPVFKTDEITSTCLHKSKVCQRCATLNQPG